MSEDDRQDQGDRVPGEANHTGDDALSGIRGYTLGLVIALLLTGASFWVGTSSFIWKPSIPVAIVVLAIAQMGVHLVFFLHVTTGPDNTNNVIALAFGTMVVLLLLFGSIWIMGHLQHASMTSAMMHNMP